MPSPKKTTKRFSTAPTGSTLIAEARKSAAQCRTRTGYRSFFEILESTDPKKARELKQFVLDWIRGGEARTLLPRTSDLVRFVNQKVCKVSRNVLERFLSELES